MLRFARNFDFDLIYNKDSFQNNLWGNSLREYYASNNSSSWVPFITYDRFLGGVSMTRNAMKAIGELLWRYLLKMDIHEETQTFIMNRVEICHDRRDRRSCKFCASCVNFSRKQRIFLQNLLRSARFTLNKYDFTLKLLKFYTLSSILTKKYLNYWY